MSQPNDIVLPETEVLWEGQGISAAKVGACYEVVASLGCEVTVGTLVAGLLNLPQDAIVNGAYSDEDDAWITTTGAEA